MSDGRPQILVLCARGFGALLTALPALRALAAAYPMHRRVLATSPPLVDFARGSDLADAVLPVLPSRGLAWDSYRPALAVDLHGAGPESHYLLLDARPARLVAFRHPLVPQ